MRTVKNINISVEIEIDDENTSCCSVNCNFWECPHGISHCILFGEDLEVSGDVVSLVRTEQCKKHFPD